MKMMSSVFSRRRAPGAAGGRSGGAVAAARISAHSPRSVVATLIAAAVACAYLALILLGGAQQASAAPTAPAFLGEITAAEVPGDFKPYDVAVDPKTGDMYFPVNQRVVELSPYGQFILSFGGEVDRTKVEAVEREEAKGEVPTQAELEEENICTAASGDDCTGDGSYGRGADEFWQTDGIAIERSTGDVYVYDNGNHRIAKYTPSGSFLLTFGRDVNKAKTEALGGTPTPEELAEASICVAGEECKSGTRGTAEGQLEYSNGDAVTVGGPEGKELVYVGDKARIEVFRPDGEFKEQLSLSSLSATDKVNGIAADTAGDVFFFDERVAGVHVAETNETSGELELSATLFDESSTGVEALTVAAGNLYVADGGPPVTGLIYEVGKPAATPTEFSAGEPGEIYSANGIAVDELGTVTIAARYVREGYSLTSFYGSLSAMEGRYGPPPSLSPAVTALVKVGPEETTGEVEAQINPELWPTTYQLEYGTQPCRTGGCTKTTSSPVSLGSVTRTEHQLLLPLSGLQAGTTYYYRFTVANSVGAAYLPEAAFKIGRNQQAGPTGLPDGRIYEQATPADKFGNEVLTSHPAFVASGGDAVMYSANGAVTPAAANSTATPLYVSERTSHGWVTRSATPMPVAGTGPGGVEEYSTSLANIPVLMVPSADLSHLVFNTNGNSPYTGAPAEAEKRSNNTYLAGPDPFAEPEWIAESQIEGAPEGEGECKRFWECTVSIAGTSPDLKTVYFYDKSTLLPGASHLYEYREGVLSDAGVLPNGETSAGEAIPAALPIEYSLENGLELGHGMAPGGFDNQVSADGSRLFFTRIDEAGIRELYARVTNPDGSQRTLLVSQSQVAGHEGSPASHGPLPAPSTEMLLYQIPGHRGDAGLPSYVFASPDGSHAFFESIDRLTEDAPEDRSAKTYEFDLESGKLEYLPKLTGSIVAVSADGSSLVFENTAVRPFELERWVAAPAGGEITPIAQLPEVASNNVCEPIDCVGPAFMSANGDVVAFETEAAIPGFNDGGTEENVLGRFFAPVPIREVFRYDAETAELTCVSCPARGVAQVGSATMARTAVGSSTGYTPNVITPGTAMSADGQRIFFDTEDALVPQDVNGMRDVYEWENGRVYLISSGHSPDASYFSGVSESAGDAFFMTSEGLVPGDTDGNYDVYDARIPRPGDRPTAALPCEGAVCQGPPGVPSLLGAPASEAFNGPGNLTPKTPVKHGRKGKQAKRRKKLRKALKACKRRFGHSRHRRRECMSHARKKYGAKAARRRDRGRHTRNRHHNGRGK